MLVTIIEGIRGKQVRIWFTVCLLTASNVVISKAWSKSDSGFDIVALGTSGGLRTNNLSAFLIGPQNQNVSVACDAGTLIDGIDAAIDAGSFTEDIRPTKYPFTLSAYLLKEHIKGYLISHGHLDHIAGLIIASTDDSAKPIYALEPVLETIKNTHFNWQSWPNFGSEGNSPTLSKYQYINLSAVKAKKIKNTPMTVTALPLSHNGVVSSAFVIEYKEDIVVCLGDTGADSVEKSTKLKQVWQFIKPKVLAGKLKAIIIESSFTNEQADNKLYGHLTPKYVNEELLSLANEIGSPEALQDLPVIISHIKPSFTRGLSIEKRMLEQLESENKLSVNFIIPKQGQRWRFP